MSTEKKSKEFQRNVEFENLLKDLNSSLWLSEKELVLLSKQIDYLIVYIMRALRSGTTITMQWLATSGLVNVPTNLLSRFYKAPIVGAVSVVVKDIPGGVVAYGSPAKTVRKVRELDTIINGRRHEEKT